MTFTKVTNTGIGSTGTVLLQNLDVIGIVTAGFGVSTVDVFTTGVSTFSGVTNINNTTDSTSSTTGALIVTGGVGIAASLNVGGSVSVGGTLTYEDVTNVDSVGLITARDGIVVGSGITLSPDGDVFATGVSTFIGNIHLDTDVGGENNRLLVGSNSIRNVGGSANSGYFQIEGTSANSSSMSLINNQNATNSPVLRFGKTRGTSTGAVTTVASDDVLGRIAFSGADGTDLENSTAVIEAKVTGTVAGNQIPTDLVFETSATSGNSKAERVRIKSDGKVGIGTDEPIGLLHLTATNTDCELILESDTDNDDEYDNPRIIFRQDGHASQTSIGIGGTTNDSSIHNALTFKNSCSSAGGIIFMTNNANGSLVPYQNHLEAVERLRIHQSGAFGLSGANYGSDNQALTSKGSGTPPEWRGINGPVWDSYQATAHNIANVTWTLITNLTATSSTTAGVFSSSTFTVPAGGAGTYFVYGYATIDDIQADDFVLSGITLNGASEPSNYHRGGFGCSGGANERVTSHVATLMTLSVGDTVRLSVYHNEGTTEPTEPYYTRFGGYRLSV